MAMVYNGHEVAPDIDKALQYLLLCLTLDYNSSPLGVWRHF